MKSVDPAEFFQATRFLPAIAALTSDDPATEFYKLLRGRRDVLRQLRAPFWGMPRHVLVRC